MKRFMFFSIGVLCLAVAATLGFYFGSQRVEAQSTPAVVAAFASTYDYGAFVVLENGDTYYRSLNRNANGTWSLAGVTAFYSGNFLGNAVSTDKSTWSGVKGQFNK